MADDLKHSGRSALGPVTDYIPVTPNDSTDLAHIGAALYIENGGAISVVTYAGETRTLQVGMFHTLIGGFRRVRATGTTATGIHVMRVS